MALAARRSAPRLVYERSRRSTPLWDIAADVLLPGGCPRDDRSAPMVDDDDARAGAGTADVSGRRRSLAADLGGAAGADRAGRRPEASFLAEPIRIHPPITGESAPFRSSRSRCRRFSLADGVISSPRRSRRAFARIQAPKRLLIGPWLHVQPGLAARRAGRWLAMLLAFWDEHLRGEAPAGEPPVRVFVRKLVAGGPTTSWPPPRTSGGRAASEARTGRLGPEPGEGAAEYESTPLVRRLSQATAIRGHAWDRHGLPAGPGDQTRLPLPHLHDRATRQAAGNSGFARSLGSGARASRSRGAVHDRHEARRRVAGWVRGAGHYRLGTKPRRPDGDRAMGDGVAVRAGAPAATISPPVRDFPRIWPDPEQAHIRLDLARSHRFPNSWSRLPPSAGPRSLRGPLRSRPASALHGRSTARRPGRSSTTSQATAWR